MPESNLKKSAVSRKTKVANKPKGRRWSHEISIIGLRFRMTRSGREALARLVAKASIPGCRLEREPDNPADPNAIRVFLPERVNGGSHIAYVPRQSAAVLAPKMDDGSLAVANAVLESLEGEDLNEGTLCVTFIDVAKAPAKRRKTAKAKK